MAHRNNVVELLEWDSAFFNFPIGQIKKSKISALECQNALDFCKKSNVRLLQFKCESSDRSSVKTVEKADFHFVDVRISFKKQLTSKPAISASSMDYDVKIATQNDIVKLQSIAKGMFTHSRYFHDPNFDPKQIEIFYDNWIEKAVLGTFDNYVLSFIDETQITAFCSVRVRHKNAQIGLFGVSKHSRGKGRGKLLLEKTLESLFLNGFETVSVVTQGRNISACNLYIASGFFVENIQLYYHKWF